MDLADRAVDLTLVATVLVTTGMAIGTAVSGRPGWARTVLYGLGMAGLIGLCAGLAANAQAGGVVGELLLGGNAIALALGSLWLIYTVAAVLGPAPANRRLRGK
jgi:hypothetical protein